MGNGLVRIDLDGLIIFCGGIFKFPLVPKDKTAQNIINMSKAPRIFHRLGKKSFSTD